MNGKERRRLSEARRRAAYAGEGICIRCRTAPKLPGSPWCDPCRDARSAEASARYHRAVASGTCTSCTRPAVPGLTVCAVHREAALACQRTRADTFRAGGVCIGCGAERVPGSVYCGDCRVAASARRSKYDRISGSEYLALLDAQGGVCAVCGRPQPEKHGKGRLFVDHDHATGMVRGLLCHFCNVAIGAFRDDPETMRQAASYIEEARAMAARAPRGSDTVEG